MATQHLSVQAPEGNTPQTKHEPAAVSYTAKNGQRIDLASLRLNLEIVADDLDTAESLAREAEDHELADALGGLFNDVDGLIPAAGDGEVKS